jgi:anti-sigma regulatory factor (Ser/Thr protein kinase)
MRTSRRFERRIDSLAEMVAFAAAALADRDVDTGQRAAIDFAIEELFTNMLKYSRSGADPVEIAFECDTGGVLVTLVDTGVEPFDITAAPQADVDLPLVQRQPGGLGLHLVRRVVNELSYEYRPATRESRIRFRVPSRRPT